jgi:feruloyl esterase
MRYAVAFLSLVLSAAPAFAQARSVAAADCSRLAMSLSLTNTTVTSAQPVEAGRFTPPAGGAAAAKAAASLPAFCRVALTIKPSADSDIKSEVWLPMTGWNGKFLQVGNGAWGGSIQYGPLAEGLRRGYAVASTDTGHTGGDASFAVGHPEKLIDFGYRSVHETAMHGKATIAALYGSQPRLSYFEGCSGGGRMSFMEAQRYPNDFDAIIAGAPGYNRTDVAFQTLGMMQATHASKDSFIPPSKYAAIHKAALDACDANDGLKDGLIANPPSCKFDPGVMACSGADSPSCLTPAQVTAARKIYADVTDPKTGKVISPGLEPGSEPQWGAVAANEPHPMYLDLLRYIVHGDAKWEYTQLDINKDLEKARQVDRGTLSATSPDIAPFVNRGGKLLMYHGWGDMNIPPQATVDYYNQVVATLGKEKTASAVKLFMVPGMGHCGGGDGPNEFDMLAALDQWRDKGQAPASIPASQSAEGSVIRTRPLCPYPQIAKYKGAGSIDKAENFACSAP